MNKEPNKSESNQYGSMPGRGARDVVDAFHRLYYSEAARTWQNTYWRGALVLKCPMDLWIYQELMVECSPDIVIETGTAFGGSALYLASIFDMLGKGRVMTIDINRHEQLPEHPRIQYITGSSTDEAIVAQVAEGIGPAERCFVILDSDHSQPHVLDELRMYSGFVAEGDYLIVEDTNVNGHPVFEQFGPGPMEAVDVFLGADDRFVVDRDREKFFMTFNPRGFLRRIK